MFSPPLMGSHRKTPLAFFAYNRPEHTIRALGALALCHRQEDFEFFFFADGPRHTGAIADVYKVRQILAENAERFSAEIIEREFNLGLAKSIVDGVGRLCESHGRVVVLEDDLIVSPDFLHYMVSALDHYQDHPEVMQVGAYTIAPPKDRDTDAFLLPVTTTWGWGTWARAWKQFSWTPEGWPVTRSDAQWLSRFEINGAFSYIPMLEDRLAGRNDSWGILWWYAVSRAGGEVVYPCKSLVWNGGFDGSGVHCGKGSVSFQKKLTIFSSFLSLRIVFPKQLKHLPEDFVRLEKLLRNEVGVLARLNAKLRSLQKRVFAAIKKKIFV
jgi:hypothetical protein